MKSRNIYLIAIALLAVVNFACVGNHFGTSPDDDYDNHEGEKITGSGYLITKTLLLSDFHSIEIACPGKVIIRQDEDQKVKLTVDDNILEYLSVKVVGEKLIIRTENGIQLENFELTLQVSTTDIYELSTSSIGYIEVVGTLTAENIVLNASSIGHIRIELEAETLRSYISSIGSIYVSGNAKNHYASIASLGTLHAFDLNTKSTEITVSSIGNAEITVRDHLGAIISSIGSVFYKGNPVIHSTVTSLGKLVNSN